MTPETFDTVTNLDWHMEECQHMVLRLRRILASPDASPEDKRIAADMLHFYHSMTTDRS